MKLATLLLLCAVTADAQNIGQRILTPGTPIKIELSPAVTTTLLFPSEPSGTFGTGIQTKNQMMVGDQVHLSHPNGSNVVLLYALNEQARVVATVLLEGKLYVLLLESSPTPDVAITLVKEETTVRKAEPVTPQQIVDSRPKYDPELLIMSLRKAHDAPLLKPLYPKLYEDFTKRDCNYTHDSGSVKTNVQEIDKFKETDTIVLRGSVHNELDRPLSFDGRAATVQVANETHPAKIVDCLRPIPPYATVPIDVAIQGGIDGNGRAGLSIDNEFIIILGDESSVWNFKNGKLYNRFSVPKPVQQPTIPLTQTGKPKKD